MTVFTDHHARANEALDAHLRTGATNIAHIWIVRRRDGQVMGFTDHDRDLVFQDVVCQAMAGLTATAVTNVTGMAIDHSEAIGALTASTISEHDIQAGHYDEAEVEIYIVNWADLNAWRQQFRGRIGEITRSGGAFRAELRGLSDPLNTAIGRVYTKTCSAVLGDGRCGFDLSLPGYRAEVPAGIVTEARDFAFDQLSEYAPGWFARGVIEVLTGDATGQKRVIKYDRIRDARRLIGVWQPFDAALEQDDVVRIVAGCDKRFETCRKKFDNAVSFRGFPDLPGSDWGEIVPARAPNPDGGSRR